jgi:hypothetical protein
MFYRDDVPTLIVLLAPFAFLMIVAALFCL